MLSHLFNNILPLVNNSIDLKIIGPNMDPGPIPESSNIKIEYLGFVDDLDVSLKRCRVMLAPVRIASGTQTKILDALKNGLTVITTSIAFEGLDLPAIDTVKICDASSEFAEQIDILSKADSLALSNISIGAYNNYISQSDKIQRTAFDKFIRVT